MVLLQTTTMPDISLQQLGWIVGGVVAYVLYMLYKDQAAALWRQYRARSTVKHYAQADHIMSRATDQRTSPELVPNQIKKPDAYQAHQPAPAPLSEVTTIVASHNMSDKELTLMLAAQQRDGKPRWSANDIVKLIGGTRQEVLDTIAIVRPREKPVEEATKGKAPITGRPYNPANFHSDDPTLQYQEPTT